LSDCETRQNNAGQFPVHCHKRNTATGLQHVSLGFVPQPNLPGATRLLFTPASSRVSILFAEPCLGLGLVLGLGAPSFNTCFNLHFTSPPFLFKLFPLFFGLALHVSFKTKLWYFFTTLPPGRILYVTRKQKRPVKKHIACCFCFPTGLLWCACWLLIYMLP
jgi:hypothetical protein